MCCSAWCTISRKCGGSYPSFPYRKEKLCGCHYRITCEYFLWYKYSDLYSCFKKCRKEDDNILFIDASKEFEKVKTQNKLREQHIQKIVETYRDRKEIEKYSHLASLQEIAENDYNLNIPRYVDTFEEEEPIDIKAVMAEIKELEAKRAELNKEIEVYLKELGLVE